MRLRVGAGPLLLLAWTATAGLADGLRVVTTTTDLAALARAVGGDRIEVESIARGYQDPHYVEAKPSYMRRLNKADLLIYNGLELEIGWLPLLIQGSRNSRVMAGATGNLNASEGVAIREIPAGEVHRAMGDIHPSGNPHYTLDPRNGFVIAAAIATRLRQLTPTDSAAIDADHESFRRHLNARLRQWEERAAPLRGLQVVALHKQWEYLAAWLDIDIVDYIEDRPGIPASPGHVAALVDLMRRAGVPLVIHAGFADRRPAARLAARSDARVLGLPAAVGAAPGVDTYTDLFETILASLEETLRE